MPHSQPASPPIEIVIPDCCNVGVVARALLAVNGVMLAAILARTPTVMGGIADFVELSVLLEPACLTSLMALCGLRRIVRTIPLWGQRAVSALTPAAVTGLISRIIMSNELMLAAYSYRTVIAGMAIAALFGLALQHYYELRTRAFSPALAEARLQALQARIRPHFLYNSLNAVLAMIRSEPRRAEATLEDLADLFRVLMRDARVITTLDEEIRLCRQYLSIEQVRLGSRLQVEWDMGNVTDEVLRQAQFPSLLLQPLLENAVHYGVEPAEQPVLVRVALSRSIDRIEIAVTNPIHDPRQGAAAAPGNQMALDNIRQRLDLLHDIEAELSTSTEGGVFQVRLRLPYVKGP